MRGDWSKGLNFLPFVIFAHELRCIQFHVLPPLILWICWALLECCFLLFPFVGGAFWCPLYTFYVLWGTFLECFFLIYSFLFIKKKIKCGNAYDIVFLIV